MSWGGLQALTGVSLLVLVVCVRGLMAVIRRPALQQLEEARGKTARLYAAVADVLVVLVYLAFALFAIPFPPSGEWDPVAGQPVGDVEAPQIDILLNVIGGFALLVAILELVVVLVLNGAATGVQRNSTPQPVWVPYPWPWWGPVSPAQTPGDPQREPEAQEQPRTPSTQPHAQEGSG